MLNLRRRQGQPEHERLRDEIIGFVLARRPPPASLVTRAQAARDKDAAARERADSASAVEPPPARRLHVLPRPSGDAAGTRAQADAARPGLEWRMRELKRSAAVRDYIAEVGLTPATRQRLQDYAHELHGLGERHGYAPVAKIALLLGALVERESGTVFSTVETYLTCLRVVLRGDVKDLDHPLAEAMIGELYDLAATSPAATSR